MRIAMWSGPRNLSTAIMYAFGNRADCTAVDEPFYAAYLAATGLDHPMRTAVLASQSPDADRVAADLAEGRPGHRYFKLMTHHMLPDFPRDWMNGAAHVFLIRHPARVVASYTAKREAVSLADIGFVEQVELFGHVCAIGQLPVVVDSDDIRRDPDGMLRKLCDAIGLPFDPAMLSWPAGPKPFDGAWAPHWYGAVHRTTGIAGAEGPLPQLDGDAARYAELAMRYYEGLHALRLT